MLRKVLKLAGIVIGVIALVAVAAYIVLVPRPMQTPKTVADITELETFLTELAGHNVDSPPGISLVVIQDGEIVYEKGFGLADGPRNRPATPDTVYQYWSMTKIFTAVAIFQLQEQDLLDLDDPVTEYLTFFDVD